MPADRLRHHGAAARAPLILRFGLALLGSGCLCGGAADQRAPVWEYVETGDLPALRTRGKLRVLYLPSEGDARGLPRGGPPLDVSRDLAEELAEELKLEPVLVPVSGLDQLIPWLLEGRGDLVAANLTVTEERAARVAFGRPLATVVEQVVGRATEPAVQEVADLADRELWVRPASSAWRTAQHIQAAVPGLTVQPAPDRLDHGQLVARVARGEYDLTIVDDNHLRALQLVRDDVAPLLSVTAPRPVAWAVRPGAEELLAAMNAYLEEARIRHRTDEVWTSDLPGLRARGTLRVLTRNNSATYYLHRGELRGFDFELAQRFAESQDLRLQMVVPPRADDLLDWLQRGRGDLVAAALTVTPEREALAGVHWSSPTNTVREVLVKRAGDPLDAPEALEGRTVVVRRSSAYWSTLHALRASGVQVTIEPAPEDVETEALIARVAAGDIDLTAADSVILDIELTWRDDVAAAFPLGPERAHGWAVRADAPELAEAVDGFLEAEVGGPFYNVVHQRYFRDERGISEAAPDRVSRGGQLSPYDELVKQHAEEYGFDWRMIVAQMYQESHFDPHAVSWSGARGLLQLLPGTADELGYEGLHRPEVGIEAGVTYLHWVRNRFEPELDPVERLWFALAAYNAGFGHVLDAREVARRRGLDPDRWFGNTEEGMLLLAQPEVAARARYGYCRGNEPVDYVRRIRERFAAYVAATEARE